MGCRRPTWSWDFHTEAVAAPSQAGTYRKSCMLVEGLWWGGQGVDKCMPPHTLRRRSWISLCGFSETAGMSVEFPCVICQPQDVSKLPRSDRFFPGQYLPTITPLLVDPKTNWCCTESSQRQPTESRHTNSLKQPAVCEACSCHFQPTLTLHPH